MPNRKETQMIDTLTNAVQAAIDNLYQIAEQVAASSEASTEQRAQGKLFDKASTLIGDNFDEFLSYDGVTDTELNAASATLAKLYGLLTPKVEVLWKDDDIQKQLTAVKAMSDAGMLSDDQTAIVQGIASRLAKGSGLRGPRTDAPVIAGRPEKVVVTMLIDTDDEGNPLDDPITKTVSTMTGDKKQSPENLFNALLRLFYGKEVTDDQRKSDAAKVMREAARKACGAIEGHKASVEVISNVTLTPSAPRDSESE